MRHNRLKLVTTEDRAKAGSDSSTDSLAGPTTPDSCVRPLHVVDADAPLFPDDAA
jgi:hypothetical protein